jgi:hypothetical protein
MNWDRTVVAYLKVISGYNPVRTENIIKDSVRVTENLTAIQTG